MSFALALGSVLAGGDAFGQSLTPTPVISRTRTPTADLTKTSPTPTRTPSKTRTPVVPTRTPTPTPVPKARTDYPAGSVTVTYQEVSRNGDVMTEPMVEGFDRANCNGCAFWIQEDGTLVVVAPAEVHDAITGAQPTP